MGGESKKAAVEFVSQYGGRCRDCADDGPVCPNSGLPCGGRAKAIEFVIRALSYGVDNGFIPDPFAIDVSPLQSKHQEPE